MLRLIIVVINNYSTNNDYSIWCVKKQRFALFFGVVVVAGLFPQKLFVEIDDLAVDGVVFVDGEQAAGGAFDGA